MSHVTLPPNYPVQEDVTHLGKSSPDTVGDGATVIDANSDGVTAGQIFLWLVFLLIGGAVIYYSWRMYKRRGEESHGD